MKKNQKRLIVLGLASMSLVLAACQSGENSSTSSSTSTSSDTVDDTPVIPTPTNASIRLVSPEEGASFSITPEAISTYLNADTEAKQIEAIAKAKLAENKDLTSSPVRLSWQKDGSAYYTVSLADNPSFENAVQAKVSSLSTSYEANNLIPNSTYYWKVKGTRANDESKVQTFKTTGASVRFISAPGAYNIRDLGGWKAGSKTLPYGKLFRGSLLNNFNGYADLNEAGKETFNNTLGIQTEIDLRQPEKDDGNQSECFFDPSKKYVKAQLGQYNRILDPENFASAYDQNSYGAMVTSTDKSLSNAAYANDGITVRSLRDIFAVLSDESNYPVYFHCNAGADRTGTLAFLIEGLLGVSYADTIRDFELTSFSKFGERLRSKVDGDQFDKSGVYMDVINDNYVGFGKLYQDLMEYYGDGKDDLSLAISNYLTGYCGILPSQIQKVKEILLEEKKNEFRLTSTQEFVLEGASTLSLNLEEAGLDENSISSITCGGVALGKDASAIDVVKLNAKKIAGEREFVVEAKKNGKDITVYAPTILITKMIKTVEEFKAIDTYRPSNQRIINFGYYRLANDIGSSKELVRPLGWISDQHNSTGASGFRGTIDGAGHKVYAQASYGGLFSIVGGGAKIQNVEFILPSFGTASGNNSVVSLFGPSLCGAVIEDVKFTVLSDGFGSNYAKCLYVSGAGFIASNVTHSTLFKNVEVSSVAPIVSLFGGVSYEGMGGVELDNFTLNCDKIAYAGLRRTTSVSQITAANGVPVASLKGVKGSYKAFHEEKVTLDLGSEFASIDVGSAYGSMSLQNASYNGTPIAGAALDNQALMFETSAVNAKDGDTGSLELSLEKEGLRCIYSIPVQWLR